VGCGRRRGVKGARGRRPGWDLRGVEAVVEVGGNK
jgi:hypothetical protein